ncbi:MAG: cell division protein FtsZ [Methyloceanibacter sp.]
MTINLKVPDLTELKPRITVFGVGGAGGNAVNNMIASGLRGIEFVVANTDAQALLSSSAERRIQMGVHVTEGLGAGSKPDIGAAAAEEAMADIKAHLASCHMTFITAGMGGGTGTGAAPVIARASREEGILTVGVVTKPFQFEGQRRMRAAEAGIMELQKYVDTLLVIPNQNLFRVANEKTTFADAFAMADDVLRAGVSCITDLMVKEGLINLDFADVRTIMAGMGKAMMGTGESSGDRRAIEAAEAAISNPLLDDVSMKGASGLLVSITGGNDLTLYEVDEAASRIRGEADPEANIIVGATFDDELDGSIRVSVVATGLGQLSSDAFKPGHRDRDSLTQRLAGLATMPAPVPVAMPTPGPQFEPAKPVRVAAEAPSDAQVWRAPGNVTIERRPPQLAASAMPQGVQPQRPMPPAQSFVPAAPATAPRPVRRMPNIEEFPLPVQNEVKALSGAAPSTGIPEQKKKVGFLERLTGVARGRKDEDAAVPDKREPDFGTPKAVPMMPKTVASKPVEALPKGLKIERPDSDIAVATMQKRIEAQPKVVSMETREPVDESPAEDDLEIPAFLRRRAK